MELKKIYENKCLIINYDLRKKNLNKICIKFEKKHEKKGLNFKDCKKWLKKVKKLGYVFEFGLDLEPYNLMKKELYIELLKIENKNKENLFENINKMLEQHYKN